MNEINVIISTAPTQMIAIIETKPMPVTVGMTLPGQKGDNGLTPFVGVNGNWFIGQTDTGLYANGLTPHIDINTLRWFIGDTDTGISARGVSGPPGPSAYEIAVINGFVGTANEWLESLKATVSDGGTF